MICNGQGQICSKKQPTGLIVLVNIDLVDAIEKSVNIAKNHKLI